MNPPASSRLESPISLGLILLGVLIACSSNDLRVTVFGIGLLLLGGALYRRGNR